jgi:hypothetical protein
MMPSLRVLDFRPPTLSQPGRGLPPSLSEIDEVCRINGEKTATSWPGTGDEPVGMKSGVAEKAGETTAASWPWTGYCVPRPRFWAAWTQLPVPVCCVKAKKLRGPVSSRQTPPVLRHHEVTCEVHLFGRVVRCAFAKATRVGPVVLPWIASLGGTTFPD